MKWQHGSHCCPLQCRILRCSKCAQHKLPLASWGLRPHRQDVTGTQRDTSWTENAENLWLFSFAGMIISCIMAVLLIFTQHKYSFGFNLSPAGCSHTVLLFTKEEQEKVGSWRTSAAHADLVCNNIITDCQTQNGSTHSHISVIFKDQFRKKKREKNEP